MFSLSERFPESNRPRTDDVYWPTGKCYERPHWQSPQVDHASAVTAPGRALSAKARPAIPVAASGELPMGLSDAVEFATVAFFRSRESPARRPTSRPRVFIRV